MFYDHEPGTTWYGLAQAGAVNSSDPAVNIYFLVQVSYDPEVLYFEGRNHSCIEQVCACVLLTLPCENYET